MSLGEVMLRLSPPRFERLRRAREFRIEVAGSQFNVAANVARFGKKTAFLTSLPDNELGDLVIDEGAGYGMDTSHMLRTKGSRVGLNFVEFTATPRTPRVVYDRASSAASGIGPDAFDWEAILAETRVAHTDGIFPGLSSSCEEATERFLVTAVAVGCRTTFDLNYREHIWSPERALECWSRLLPHVNVIVTNRDVSELVFGFTGTDGEIASMYSSRFGCETVVITHREMNGVARGAWSSSGWQSGQMVRGHRQEFEVVDRYGTGDAFLSGLVYGLLERDLSFGLDFGNAACALAHTVEGDVTQFSATEVLHIMDEVVDLRLRR